MVIIAILIGLGTWALPRPNPVHGAQIVGGLLEQARIEAMTKGSPSAVVILADSASEERMKKVGVVRLRSSDNDALEEATWEFTSTPFFLPAGLLFDETGCTSDQAGADAKRKKIPELGGAEGEGVEWMFYGFTSGGEPHQPGGRIVVGDPKRSDYFRVELTASGRPTPPISNLMP